MINVLMTGAGAPGAPGIIKYLQKVSSIKLFTADMDPSATGRYLNSRFTKIPAAKDDNFTKILLDFSIENKIDVILPLVTQELEKLSKETKLFFDNAIKVIVSEHNALKNLNDKGKFYSALVKHGIDCPSYKIATKTNIFLKHIDDFLVKYGICVIKPCSSNGSRGMRVISSQFDRYKLLFDEKPSSIHMTLDELKLILMDRNIPPMMVCEYLPGTEVTVDTLHCKGKLKLVLIRERIATSGGISTKGRFIEDNQVYDLIYKVSKSFKGLHGPVGFQLKQDIKGKYQFLESNPRIQGTSVASGGLGINFPELCVRIAHQGDIKLNFHKSGIGFARYFDEVFFDTKQ
jgi:carbamoyl-phosphate synthase large subunit